MNKIVIIIITGCITLSTFYACYNVNQSPTITTELSVYQDSTINFLLIKLQNNSNSGVYFEALAETLHFYDVTGKDITDSLLSIIVRQYVPPEFINQYASSICDINKNPSQFDICFEYDSIIKYKNTKIGSVLFTACNIEYENFLLDNGLNTFKDSVFVKELFLLRNTSSVFIESNSTFTKCLNLQHIYDNKMSVKIMYRFIPKINDGFSYWKLFNTASDSFKIRNYPLKEVRGYSLFMDSLISDTLSITYEREMQ